MKSLSIVTLYKGIEKDTNLLARKSWFGTLSNPTPILIAKLPTLIVIIFQIDNDFFSIKNSSLRMEYKAAKPFSSYHRIFLKKAVC